MTLRVGGTNHGKGVCDESFSESSESQRRKEDSRRWCNQLRRYHGIEKSDRIHHELACLTEEVDQPPRHWGQRSPQCEHAVGRWLVSLRAPAARPLRKLRPPCDSGARGERNRAQHSCSAHGRVTWAPYLRGRVVVFGRRSKEHDGLFLCGRKNNKLRLILDAQRGNTRLHAPLRDELVTAEGLSSIEFDMTRGTGSVPVFCGATDVQDAFQSMEYSIWALPVL